MQAQSTNVVTRKNVIPNMGARYSNYFTVQSQKELKHYINGKSYKWSWKITNTKGKLINDPQRRQLQFIGIGRVWWFRKNLIQNTTSSSWSISDHWEVKNRWPGKALASLFHKWFWNDIFCMGVGCKDQLTRETLNTAPDGINAH